jgi:DNA polymerase I-like protein with 3'-5' exonuclease and polymerase domains/uracil-DNA glycosylase
METNSNENEARQETSPHRLAKTNHCKACPAFDAPGRCRGLGHSRADIAFVLGPPKIEVADHGYTAFTDGNGQFFRTVYKKISESKLEYKSLHTYFTHAAQCVVEHHETESIARCSPIVHRQLDASGCKVIVAMGSAALKSFGIVGSVDSLRGKIIPIKINGRDVLCVPTYNPGALLRKENMGLYSIFVADLHKALSACLGALAPQKTIADLTKNYRIAKTVEDAKTFLEQVIADHLNPDTWLSMDTETTGLEPWVKDFRCIAFSMAWGDGQAASILMNHRDLKGDWLEILPLLKQVLEGPNPKVFHNWRYDFQVLELALGLKVNNVQWDSMFGEYLLNENKIGFYGLKAIVEERVPDFAEYEKDIKKQFHKTDAADRLKQAKEAHKKLVTELKTWNAAKRLKPDDKDERARINETIKTLKESQGRAKAEIVAAKNAVKQEKEENANFNFEMLNTDDMLLYAAIDADCTRRITRQQIKEITDEKDQNDRERKRAGKPAETSMFTAIKGIMLPSARVLGRMEYEGVRIDMDYLADLEGKFQEFMDTSELEVFKAVGHEFKISSTKQLINVLVGELGLKIETKTKKGGISVGKDSLKVLTGQHPVIEPLGIYRKAFSARNNFLAGIRATSVADGRVHGRYNQVDTLTGRLSCSRPNLQNIAAKGILGLNIKKLFIPDNTETEEFCNADYSGAEIRVLTAYAHDPGLIKTLNDGLNIHSDVAAKVFGPSYQEIQDREQLEKTDHKRFLVLDGYRQTAKGMVFLTIYGGGALKLHEKLVQGGATVTLADCEAYIEKFLNSYPIIRTYMFNVKGDVHTKASTNTRFGRVRRFPLAGLSFKQKNAAYREAINFPIQSTSSDLVLSQLCEMGEHAHELGIKLRLTVHDSIAFIYPKANRDKIRPFLDKYLEQRVAEKFPWLPVPFAYEAAYGPTYGECKNVIKKL